VGGEILYVETTATKGKGMITLTGQLGDVMKESAHAALGLIKWRAKDFGLNEDVLSTTDVHVHYPQAAIPKDGPSAGITMATAIISRLTGIPIRKDVAMTGEITLTGRVLPIGGLKEKALAAMRHGIKTVIIPDKNKKDLEDIPAEYRKMIEFVPVKSIDEVLAVALTEKIKGLHTDDDHSTKKPGGTQKRRSSGAVAAAAASAKKAA
jgi:ATP-dependent Lon protease